MEYLLPRMFRRSPRLCQKLQVLNISEQKLCHGSAAESLQSVMERFPSVLENDETLRNDVQRFLADSLQRLETTQSQLFSVIIGQTTGSETPEADETDGAESDTNDPVADTNPSDQPGKE